MSVCAFFVVILFFEWLYHLLGVEFWKINTINESKIVKIVGNWSDLVEYKPEMTISPLAPMRLIFTPLSSYWRNLHYGMIKMCFDNFENLDASQKILYFFYERSSSTNYWWERPLVVVLKHSGKIKQYVLYHKQQAYINCKLSNTHLLFLSSVSLFYFSHSIA